MIIGLDFDGVIADTFPIKARFAKELFGIILDPTYSKEWHMIEKGLLTKEQYRTLATHAYQTEAGLEMPPIPNAISTAQKLIDAGHTLKIITSRNEEEARIAQLWCKQHDLAIPMTSVGYGASKADALLGVTCYIDDDYEKLIPLTETAAKLFLFSAPHNISTSISPPVTRAHSWTEFYEYIQKLT